MNEVAVNLVKRVILVDPETKEKIGWRFCPAVYVNNTKRPKPDYVLVRGKSEFHPEGTYLIDYTLNGVRKRESVGKDATSAETQRRRKEAELALGLPVEQEPVTDTEDSPSPTISQDARQPVLIALADYLDEIKANCKPRTFDVYRTDLEQFVASLEFQKRPVKKMTMADLTRNDMLSFKTYLRDQLDIEDRTQHNKFGNAAVFLNARFRPDLVSQIKKDWPKYDKNKPVEIYEPEEGVIPKLLNAADPEMRMWIKFFINTGEREQEVRYTVWEDLHLGQSPEVAVSFKKDWKWTPKAYKGRVIPISRTFADQLLAMRPKPEDYNPRALVFGTESGKPKMDFLHSLKRLAKRANANCTHCSGCKARGECDHIYLHKFRATFATLHLRKGRDLPTVQEWLGHSDLKSTMRYTRGARDAATRTAVDTMFLDLT